MHVDVVVSDVEVRSGTASFGVMSDIFVMWVWLDSFGKMNFMTQLSIFSH